MDEKKSEIHLFIGKQSDAKMPQSIMEASFVLWNPTDQRTYAKLAFFTVTSIDSTTYINVLDTFDGSVDKTFSLGQYDSWAKNPTKYSILMRFKLEGSKAQLWYAAKSEDRVKELAADGKLQANKDGLALAESLISFLRKNGGDDLFKSPGLIFTKVP